MQKKLVIYEDNERLRQSLEMLLTDLSGFAVTGSYGHCNEIATQLEGICPEIVIMDIDLPGISGIDAVRIIKEKCPGTRVMMFTVFDDDERIFRSICNGADGYLLKNTPPLKIIQGLEEIMDGGAPMSPFVARKVFHHFRQKSTHADYQLTAREVEVLGLLVKGNSYKMIAAECNVTVDTIKKHLRNIYYKLQVNCGTEAVAKAIREKIIPG